MPEENVSNNVPQDNTTQAQTSAPVSAQAFIENLPIQPTNHRKLKISIVIGIIIIVFTFVIGSSFLYLDQQKKTEISESTLGPTISPTITQIAIQENSLEVPELYPKVEWEELTTNENNSSLEKNALYSQKGEWGSISMMGKEWKASKDNLDRDAMKSLLDGFGEYYNEKLTKQGWVNSYKDEKYNLSPLAADGPGGGIWGYLKVVDGSLRVILLQKLTPVEDFGGVATCPCRVGFGVFISEIEPMDELVKRIGE